MQIMLLITFSKAEFYIISNLTLKYFSIYLFHMINLQLIVSNDLQVKSNKNYYHLK